MIYGEEREYSSNAFEARDQHEINRAATLAGVYSPPSREGGLIYPFWNVLTGCYHYDQM